MPPWEKYQRAAGVSAPSSGPWSRYQVQQGNGGVTRSPQEWADAENLPIPNTDWRAPERPETFKSPIPGSDFLNEAARAVAENIPIVGPAVDRAAQATGSQIASMISGQTPEQAQADRDYLRLRDASEQPVANAAGTVAGTVAPLMVAGTTQLGAKALGMTGPMLQRMAFGGISGGLLTSADQFARTSNATESVNSGVMGGGLGLLMPVAERGIGAVARALAGQSTPAHIRTVNRALERDGVDPSALGPRLDKLGENAVIADLGPNVMRQAGAIASLPGEGQRVVRDALTQRALGTNARIQGDVDAALGPAPVPSRLDASIQTSQRSLSPAYTEALRNAAPADTRALAMTLDDLSQFYGIGKRKAAMDKIRAWLTETDDQGQQFLTSNPSRLFMIRNELDDMVETEVGSKLGAAITDVRQQVDDLLAHSTPGIKTVDGQYQELAAQRQGIGVGQRALEGGREAPVPAELDDLLRAQPLSEEFVGPSGMPFRITQGARADLERIIGTTTNDLNALKRAIRGDGGWNRQKLASLYGPEKADQLIDILEREVAYDTTNRTVLFNSETAARNAGQKDVAPHQFGERPSGVMDLLLRLPQKAANAAAAARSESANRVVADALMSRGGPELIDQLIAARAANRGVLGASAVPLLVNR